MTLKSAWLLPVLMVAHLHAQSVQLAGDETLPAPRNELITQSLTAVEKYVGVPYRYGGSSPADGGMDCSGAVFYLLESIGIDAPRSSQAMYDWVKNSGNLHAVPVTVTSPGDPAFASLMPGDLIFWAYPDEKPGPRISHVQIYLGREKSDGRKVMVGSSDGRSYRGVKKSGFGIVDFTVPKPTSRKKIIGYGAPVWGGGKSKR